MVDRSSSNGAHAPGGPTAARGGEQHAPSGEPDRWTILLEDLSRLGRYARYYAELRLDSLKLTAREAVIAGLWGALGAVVGAAALVTSVVLLLVGMARGVNALTSNDWAGPLTTGLVVLGGAAIGLAAIAHRLRSSALVKTREKYDSLRPAEVAPPSTPPAQGAAHDRA